MPLKILIAEDSATNRLLFSTTMRRLGHEADIAGNGREALEYFTKYQYDLVFLDLYMPILNGIETARSIKEHNKRKVPVYAISGLPPDDMEARFQEAGIRKCLLKPLDRAKLEEVIRECGLEEKNASAPSSEGPLPPSSVPERLMETYARELRSRGRACLEYSQTGNMKALLRETHTIRGLAEMLHMPALSEAAGTLERDAAVRRVPPDHVQALASACQHAAETIEKHLRRQAR